MVVSDQITSADVVDEVNPDVIAVTVMLTAPLSEIKRISGQVVRIVPTTVHAESSL